jgi:hypothetical protein
MHSVWVKEHENWLCSCDVCYVADFLFSSLGEKSNQQILLHSNSAMTTLWVCTIVVVIMVVSRICMLSSFQFSKWASASITGFHVISCMHAWGKLRNSADLQKKVCVLGNKYYHFVVFRTVLLVYKHICACRWVVPSRVHIQPESL